MWSLGLNWKSFNVSLPRFLDWLNSNGGSNFEGGLTANASVLLVHFSSKPSQADQDAVTDYWGDLGEDTGISLTCVGTAATLAAPANFTLKVGDKISWNGETREISAVTTQTSVTLDSAFTTDPTSQTATAQSQAVWEYFSDSGFMDSSDQALADAATKSWDSLSTIQKKFITSQPLSVAECIQLVKTDFPPS